MNKCAVCIAKEEGIENAEDLVLQQYVQTDPSKPPMPLRAETEDVVWQMFPEEVDKDTPPMPSGGVFGTVKSVYRAIGFALKGKTLETQPRSQQLAVKRRKGSLYE